MTEPAPTPPAAPAPPTPPTAPQPPAFTPPASQADLDRIIGQRLNQERAKIGGLTADQVAELQEDSRKFREAQLAQGTDMERAIAEAKTAAQKEAEATFLPQLVQARIESAAAGRVNAEQMAKALEFTDMSKFITRGTVDVAKVTAFVDSIAPVVVPQPPARRGPTVTGHANGAGGGQRTTSTGVTAGRDLWNERNPTRAVGA